MSLDVYLVKRYPACVHCGREVEETRLFDANITHNLGAMAKEAGIYMHLWRPEEIGITKASQLVEPIRTGLKLMKSDSARFKKFDSPNGWGTYRNFVPWIEKYLAACEEYPDAEIKVSR